MIRLASLALVGLLACGGGGKKSDDTTPPPDETTEPVGTPAAPDAAAPLDFEEIDLGSSAAYIPLFKVGAEKLGCALVAEEPDPPAVAYQCEEGTMFVAQLGSTLRYTCQNITKEQCNALLERINEKVLEAAGG